MISLDCQRVRAKNLRGESLGTWQEWSLKVLCLISTIVLVVHNFGPYSLSMFTPLVLKGLTYKGDGITGSLRNSTYRASTPPTQATPLNELENYMKVNDTNMQAMQNQITNMKTELKNEFQATMLQQNNKLENMLSNYFQMNKPPSSGPLPSNTVANPKGDLKAITTGCVYTSDLPIPPPFSSSPKVVEREPEVTKDPVQPSTEKVQPPDVQTQAPISEPVNATKPKPNLPYPLRLNNQKLRERDNRQMMKFL
ncbi:hypothetical protein Tco_0868236 [Tanacetum coccineum]